MKKLIYLLSDAERKEEKVGSKAVVANNKQGHGLVLWYVGDVITSEIEEAGFCLDDAPEGISVWEGIGIWTPGPFEYPDDGDFELVGEFRKPTDEEWAAIRAGECP